MPEIPNISKIVVPPIDTLTAPFWAKFLKDLQCKMRPEAVFSREARKWPKNTKQQKQLYLPTNRHFRENVAIF